MTNPSQTPKPELIKYSACFACHACNSTVHQCNKCETFYCVMCMPFHLDWHNEPASQPPDTAQIRERKCRIIQILLRGVPTPSHGGPCGPEAGCDADCMTYSYASKHAVEAADTIMALWEKEK